MKEKKQTAAPAKAEFFLKSLKEASEKAFYPKAWLDKFCSDCWDFEEGQQECFAVLKEVFMTLPAEDKKEMIPQLVNKSKIYPRLVYLAMDMFGTLPENDRHMEIPMLFLLTDGTKTEITKAEYKWRLRHNYPCDFNENGYVRPVKAIDTACYDMIKKLQRLSASKCNCHLLCD